MASAALPLSLVVDISVVVSPTSSTSSTFNQGLIIDSSSVIPSYGGSSPRLRQYASTAAMLADGFTSDMPAYQAAQLYFGQTQAPQLLWVGVQDPTAIAAAAIDPANAGTGYVVGDLLTVTQGEASNSKLKVTSIGTGGAITALSLISGGTGFSVANDVSLAGGTGTGAEINITQVGETAAQAVQACRVAESSWYGVNVCGAAKADHLAIAAYTQSATPPAMYFYATADADVPTTATTDVFSEMQALSYNRAMGVYSTTQGGNYPANAYAGAAMMGLAMGLNTGLANSNFTMMFKKLVGVTPEPGISADVDLLNIICGSTADTSGKCGNVFVYYSGGNSWLQKSNLPNGQFADQVIGLDLLAADIQTSVVNGLLAAPSIPLNDGGQTTIISDITGACDRGVSRGFLSPGTWDGQTVLTVTAGDSFPKGYKVVSDAFVNLSAANRAKRKGMPIYVPVILTGSMQAVTIGIYVQS